MVLQCMDYLALAPKRSSVSLFTFCESYMLRQRLSKLLYFKREKFRLLTAILDKNYVQNDTESLIQKCVCRGGGAEIFFIDTKVGGDSCTFWKKKWPGEGGGR